VKHDGVHDRKGVSPEIYDQMAEAIRTGCPYQTRLDPPPGRATDDDSNFIPVSEWTTLPSHIHPPRS
jgi:hypothetical protein